ncbi:MAG: YegS/Rv2252/BmrU family lipid kinase [Clostridiales bacterium]|nr:YegS/Rv2252/BmrU family lipid kinase [Clostridiales bacterium]
MKKLLLVYNPYSGNKSFRLELDNCVEIFQQHGFIVSLFRLGKTPGLNGYLENIEKSYYDVIVSSGGDGTINIVLNAIMKNNIKTRLGVIPAGTANDFASYFKIPKEPSKASFVIASGKTKMSDIGLANDTYFINVFASGLFTNVSHLVEEEFKSFFGKFAYYIKGLEQIQNFEPIPLILTNSHTVIKEDVNLFYILNSSGTGGFEKLAPDALIDDGLFEFVGFRAMPISEIPVLFLRVVSGDYLNDPNIIYFKDNYIKIDTLSSNPEHFETDIDGESGPLMPVEIRNIQKAIEIFVP